MAFLFDYVGNMVVSSYMPQQGDIFSPSIFSAIITRSDDCFVRRASSLRCRSRNAKAAKIPTRPRLANASAGRLKKPLPKTNVLKIATIPTVHDVIARISATFMATPGGRGLTRRRDASNDTGFVLDPGALNLHITIRSSMATSVLLSQMLGKSIYNQQKAEAAN